MTRGRPPKPTADHERDGTLRKHRHEHRADHVVATGEPIKPEGLDGQASWLWEHLMDHLDPRLMATVDTAKIVSLCRWWSLWRQYDAILDEVDPSEPEHYRALMQSVTAWKQFEKLSSGFGMSPLDRAKIKLPPPPQDTNNPVMELLGNRRN